MLFKGIENKSRLVKSCHGNFQTNVIELLNELYWEFLVEKLIFLMDDVIWIKSNSDCFMSYPHLPSNVRIIWQLLITLGYWISFCKLSSAEDESWKTKGLWRKLSYMLLLNGMVVKDENNLTVTHNFRLLNIIMQTELHLGWVAGDERPLEKTCLRAFVE